MSAALLRTVPGDLFGAIAERIAATHTYESLSAALHHVDAQIQATANTATTAVTDSTEKEN